MKTKPLFLAVLSLLCPAGPAFAQFLPHTEFYYFNGINLVIPDGSDLGASDFRTLATGIDTISDLNISITLSYVPDIDPVAYTGDLYAYVSHSSGFSVLFNRVGRTASTPLGYNDNGFTITLDDQALNGDIHLYQNVNNPADGDPLTGSWQTDGRETQPDLVLDTDPRTAQLSSFNGLNADGEWTLFVADVESGAEHRVESWSMEITGVPEPGTALLFALGTVGFLLRRNRTTLN